MAENEPPTPPPQPYTPPTLVTYGDAVTLTQGTLRNGKIRDAVKSKMRTR